MTPTRRPREAFIVGICLLLACFAFAPATSSAGDAGPPAAVLEPVSHPAEVLLLAEPIDITIEGIECHVLVFNVTERYESTRSGVARRLEDRGLLNDDRAPARAVAHPLLC